MYVALSNVTARTSMPPWLDNEFFYLPLTSLSREISASNMNSLVKPTFQLSTYGIGARVDCFPLSPGPNIGEHNVYLDFQEVTSATNFTLKTTHTLDDGAKQTCIIRNGADSKFLTTQPPGRGANALELMQQMIDENDSIGSFTNNSAFCTTTIISGWLRIPAVQNDTNNRPTTSAFVMCQPKLQIARFNITIDTDTRVLMSNRTSDFAVASIDNTVVNDLPSKILGNESVVSLIQAKTRHFLDDGLNNFRWHNDSFSSDWINHLIVAQSKSASVLTLNTNFTGLLDPLTSIPNATALAPVFAGIYARIFATLLSFESQTLLTHHAEPIDVQVAVRLQVTKLYISPVMFKISLILLIAHLCTAIAYYAFRPARFLPRMPTSIASVLAYVSSSRALDDFVAKQNDNHSRPGDGKKQLYGYGRYVGRDGKTHVGIERMRYVVPLESLNPDVGRYGWWNIVRWRGKHREGRVETWI